MSAALFCAVRIGIGIGILYFGSSGGGILRHGSSAQLSSVLVVPDLRCALVRPVGLVHEELLSGQHGLLHIRQKRFTIGSLKKTRVLLAAAVNGSNDSLPRSGNYTSFLSEKWNYLTRLQRLLGPLHLVLK